MGELGSLLTRAREARGLTLEDAERDTRISRRYLQALEAEQFEVIPAPVYARGFLRSYSQYLGIDPQEALAMFPREDDAEYQRAADVHSPPQRASRETPVSPVSAARPTWRSTPSSQQQALPQIGADPRPEPQRKPTPLGRPAKREPKPVSANSEPIIGIDIGLPTPANRIKTDPAAQTRSVVVAIAALGVILGAVLVAILISNLGGGEDPPPGTSPDATRAAGDGLATSTSEAGNGASTEPGVVPNLLGLPEAQAKQMLSSAGYSVSELREKHSSDKGLVFDQSPAPGIKLVQGQAVLIVISEGP
jgi:transcriptional regulator with XRE-family HTH domain